MRHQAKKLLGEKVSDTGMVEWKMNQNCGRHRTHDLCYCPEKD